MAITITLPSELEEQFRLEADQRGVAVETLARLRLQEAELMRRILNSFPPEETRRVRRLIARRAAKTLSETEESELARLIEAREVRNAERLHDILQLASLRGVSHQNVMAELQIRPARVLSRS